MAVIVTTSAAGAPGVTTTSLGMALTWPRRVVLVEADPAGSTIAPGYLRGGTDHSRGLLNLALSDSRDASLADLIYHQCLSLDQSADGPLLLMGLADPAQATALAPMWDQLARTFASLDGAGVDVIVDAGRLTQGSYALPVLTAADAVLLFLEGTTTSAVRSHPAATALASTLSRVGADDVLHLVVVGTSDHSQGEISRYYGIGQGFQLPNDPRAADLLSSGRAAGKNAELSAKYTRTELHRSHKDLGGYVADQIKRRRQRLSQRTAV